MIHLTNLSIIYVILLLLLIGIILLIFTKKDKTLKQRTIMPLISVIVLLIVFFFVRIIISIQNDRKHEYLTDLIVEQSNIETLELVLINQKNELINPDTDEIITYLSNNKPYTLRYYEPVYLKSFDNHHLIIYSAKNTSYDHGIFQQPDGFDKNADVMMLIHKSTKRFIPLRDGEITGKNIKLDDIMVSGNTVLIPVPKNNQIRPIYFHGFTINPLYLSGGIMHYYHYDRILGFEHYQTESNHITYFAISKHEILLWVNDLGDVFIEQHHVHFSQNGSRSQIDKRPNTILNTKTYVKEGAFTVISGDIYYLDDDLSIRKIITLDFHEVVGVALSIEDWISNIPTD